MKRENVKRINYKHLRALLVQELKHGETRTTMLAWKLIAYHKSELAKLGFPRDAYNLEQIIRRQLHNLKRRGIVLERLSLGVAGEGRNFTWAYWRLSPKFYEKLFQKNEA